MHAKLIVVSLSVICLLSADFVPWCQVTSADQSPAAGRVLEVHPGDDYVPLLQSLRPGDTLLFLPGIHEGATVVRVSGTAERPITIRGQVDSHGQRPELRFTSRGSNLWRIEANHLRIHDLGFHATHGYAIRVDRATDISIENCGFRDCGGGDISANTADVDGLRIRRCRFVGTRLTPIYIGNHQGRLNIDNFVFEHNIVDGSQIRDAPNTVGYAIQLKLNVRGGVIRENFFTATLGPAIMVYGTESGEAKDASRIERNIVIGARKNPGIVIGGGPASVTNNVVLDCASGGISLQNYGRRDLLDRITLVGNVAAGNRPYDFSFARPLTRFTAAGNFAWTAVGARSVRNPPQAAEDRQYSTEEIHQPLIQMLAELHGRAPERESLEPLWESLSRPPASQAEFIKRLQPLLP